MVLQEDSEKNEKTSGAQAHKRMLASLEKQIANQEKKLAQVAIWLIGFVFCFCTCLIKCFINLGGSKARRTSASFQWSQRSISRGKICMCTKCFHCYDFNDLITMMLLNDMSSVIDAKSI